MEIINEIIIDYTDYCHNKLIEEFGSYDSSRYDPIYWCQRYKHRLIEPKYRLVVEPEGLVIPSAYSDTYAKIKKDIEEGKQLKKYQSRKLKALDYDDDMLSHWSIHHLHLGGALESDGYISRTGDLLFVFFKDDNAYIVGVFNHSSWCDLDIIEIIHCNWPQELSVFRSNTRAPQLTRDQYKALRSRNACANVVVNDGTEYLAPGIGVTANGVPLSVKFNYDKLINVFNSEFDAISANIDKVLESDPQKRTNSKLTIGLELCSESRKLVYKIKETGFQFTLSS